MPLGQMPVRGATDCGPDTRQKHSGVPSRMCGQHNVRATARDNTGKNKDNGHTPNTRKEIKIADPATNRTRVAASDWKAGTLPTMLRSGLWEISQSKILHTTRKIKYFHGRSSFNYVKEEISIAKTLSARGRKKITIQQTFR